MATKNQVDVGLSGTTGTGNFVGSNTPTLVTPTLGVASATSINFGGGAYNRYVPVTNFTPTFTFATPGDLSVSYGTQTAYYSIDGNVYEFGIVLTFTPTFSTSSGEIRVSGLTNAPAADLDQYLVTVSNSANITYGTGGTQLSGLVGSGNTYVTLVSTGSAASLVTLATTNITSGVSTTLRITGFYFI